MKYLTACILAFFFACYGLMNVNAQAPEMIWLSANTTAYKSGETVIVTVNAVSAAPIQGFTFQIRYEPACLQAVNAASPIPSMNGLPLPQTAGVVDASFASTTPQNVNGVLAEVRFLALGGCQTNLVLENAALAIRNSSGFAAPLPGISVGEKTVALNIDKSPGASQATQPVVGTLLPLGAEPGSSGRLSGLPFVLVGLLVLVVVVTGIYLLLRKRPSAR